jgi:dihydrofolate synthase/folylpolyglutamate synthase
MTYQEAIDFLFHSLPVWERQGAGAYKPGLERIEGFAEALGNPQRGFRSVHVAGTNGKGSVCHMLAAVLMAAGYRTGLFTSPHLVDFRERIRVNGQMIPEEAVVEFTCEWQDEMVRRGLSFFEMTTAMAFWWFEHAGCDVAVIETGLGGRLDSTNIITPELSIITNIGLEHTQYLGETLAAIAVEKAGIVKEGIPVVIGETEPETEAIFRAKAAELASPIVFADKIDGGVRDYELDLRGDYQQRNLVTVLAAVDVLRERFDISEEVLREGLAHTGRMTGLCGRWQVVGREPLIVLDTAHNAHGIAQVVRQIERQVYDRLFMVLGFASDKDLAAIIPLLPAGAHYILTRADTPRAADPRELARIFNLKIWRFGDLKINNALHCKALNNFALADFRIFKFSNFQITTTDTVSEALKKALSLAGPRDMIFVGGSNFVVGEALSALEMLKTEQ